MLNSPPRVKEQLHFGIRAQNWLQGAQYSVRAQICFSCRGAIFLAGVPNLYLRRTKICFSGENIDFICEILAGDYFQKRRRAIRGGENRISMLVDEPIHYILMVARIDIWGGGAQNQLQLSRSAKSSAGKWRNPCYRLIAIIYI